LSEIVNISPFFPTEYDVIGVFLAHK